MAQRLHLGKKQFARLTAEHIVLFGDKVHRARERFKQTRVAPFGARHDFVAHERAEMVGIGIGGIFAPQLARFVSHGARAVCDERAQVVAPQLEQRVAHAHATDVHAVIHGAEPAWACAYNRAHIEVLYAVVCGMRSVHARRFFRKAQVGTGAFNRLTRGFIPLVARDGLHIATLSYERRHIDFAYEQRQAERFRQLGHKSGVAFGRLAAQLVVHMQHNRRAQLAGGHHIGHHICQRAAVGAAAHHGHREGVGSRHLVCAHRGKRVIIYGFLRHGGPYHPKAPSRRIDQAPIFEKRSLLR